MNQEVAHKMMLLNIVFLIKDYSRLIKFLLVFWHEQQCSAAPDAAFSNKTALLFEPQNVKGFISTFE